MVDKVVDLRIKKEGFIKEDIVHRLKIKDSLHRVIEITKAKNPEVFSYL